MGYPLPASVVSDLVSIDLDIDKLKLELSIDKIKEST